MKKRYALKICLSAYLFFFCVLTYGQENSSGYLDLKNDTIISNKVKEYRIDSLFNEYNKDISKQSILPYDLYDYMIWQYRNGSLEKCIDIGNKCVEAINLSSNFDSLKHKKVYNNLGFFYNKKGDYYGAYRAYKTLTTVGKRDSYTAKAYQLTARKLGQLGDFYKAVDYYETSIALAKELKDHKLLIINSIDAAINYKEIETTNSIKRGITILLDAAETAEEVNKKATSNKLRISQYDLFNLYNNLANLYNDRDEYDIENSKLYYDKALKIGLQLQDSVLLANVYNDLGYLYEHQLQPQALKYYNKALKHKPDVTYSSIIYANKSRYFNGLGDVNMALENIQLSIHQLAQIPDAKFESLPSRLEVSNSISKYELLQNLIDKANVWIKFSDKSSHQESYISNALETFKLADYLVDVIRTGSSYKQSKLFWRKVASEIYLNAVKVCFKLNNLEDAFYFMEKNKALLLLEDVSLRQQRENAVIPDAIYKREMRLKKKILEQTKMLEVSNQKDSLQSALFNTKETYASFIDSLQENYRLFYQTKKMAPIITLNEVQQSLKNSGKAYIEYMLDADNGYGMLVTGTKVNFFEIKEVQNLRERSQKLRDLMTAPFNTTADETLYTNLSHSIYNDLFPNEIVEEIKGKKLTIIPDSYLQNIPFEALNTSKEKESYLLKEQEINYAYSVSFLNQTKNWKRNNTNDFIGFAPVNFKNDLSTLSESQFELDEAASLFSAVNYVQSSASTQNFIDKIKGNNIIHIASHANATDGTNPWITFADKRLSLDELYLTKNTANLVVLSACKTTIGALNEGEGVMSLARGFFNTGAQSVLSTLWNVNDKSSAQILTNFYKEIKKGKTKAEALRTSKLTYLKTHQLSELSPHYWSTFVLIGDSETVPIDTKNNLMLKIFFGFLALVISYLIYRRVKK